MSRRQSITAEDEAELRILAESWLLARPFVISPEQLTSLPPIPDALSETLTRNPAWRPRVDEEARRFLSLPQLPVLGREIRLETPITPRPFDGWPRAISPLRVRASGRDRMDSFQAIPLRQDLTWELVAHEDGRWRIVRFYDEEIRVEIEWECAWMVWHMRGRVGPCPERPRALRLGRSPSELARDDGAGPSS